MKAWSENHLPSDRETQREGRITYICALMRNLRFTRGKTYKLLAKKWDLHPDVVKKMTAEASKRVAAEVRDPDHVTATVGSALELSIKGAVTAKDFKSVAGLAKTWADVMGVSAAARIEHTHRNELPNDEAGLLRVINEELAKRGATSVEEALEQIRAKSQASQEQATQGEPLGEPLDDGELDEDGRFRIARRP